LKNAGYATAILGKYLTGHVPKRPPGFSEWVVTRSQRYFRTRVIDNGTRRVIERYSTTFLGDKATRFLRARESADEVPWFLLVTPRAPHFPFTPEDRYAGAPVPAWDRSPAVEELDTSDKPRWVPGKAATAKAARIRTKQLRALMSVDDLVLRLRSSLRSLGEERETLVFYLSDNGFMWGDHGLTGKNLPYSAAVKAPLLVRWPGHMEGGRSKRLVANIDLAPTIFQATRVQPPSSPIDGRSLFSPRARKTLLLEHWGSRGRPAWASLRSESFHFVQYYGETGKVIFREYYDLRTDPWELRNVLRDGEPGNDPDLKRLQRRLTVLRKCVGKACP
jgi:arylsulfatase A-like enzyme